jgi:hypothetical protein
MDQELLLERGWGIFHKIEESFTEKIGEVEESYNLFFFCTVLRSIKKDSWIISSSSNI